MAELAALSLRTYTYGQPQQHGRQTGTYKQSDEPLPACDLKPGGKQDSFTTSKEP